MESAVEKALSELNQAEKKLRRAVGETFPEGARVTWMEHGLEASFRKEGRIVSGQTYDPKSVCVRTKNPRSAVDHIRFLPAALLTPMNK